MTAEGITFQSIDHFVVVPAWVLASDITPTAFKLYALLRRLGDNETGASFYSLAVLGQKLGGKSADTARRAMRELQGIGAVVIRERYTTEGDQTSNLYQVLTRPFEGSPTRLASMQGGPSKSATTPRAPLRGDLKTNLSISPQPPSEATGCGRHETAVMGCRGCGTTKRQIAQGIEQARREAAPRLCLECLRTFPVEQLTRRLDDKAWVCLECAPPSTKTQKGFGR